MGLKIFIGAIAFTILFNIFFFGADLQIGWGLLFLFINSYFFFTRRSKTPVVLGLTTGFLATVFGFFNGVYDNTFIQVVNVLVAICLTIETLFLFRLNTPYSYQFTHVIFLPFKIAFSSVTRCLSYISSAPWTSRDKKNSRESALIRGVLIATPIIFILLMLFSNADPIFGKFLTSFTHNLSARLIVSLIIFALSFGIAFASIDHDPVRRVTSISKGKAFELGILAVLISLVLWSFIGFQITYLFKTVGERQLHTLGISQATYSEYVRRGFVELALVAVITSGVLFYIIRYVRLLARQEKIVIRSLCLLMTAGIALVMLSAGKRLILQVNTHGLTDIRIFGFFFLAELVLIIGMLTISLLKNVRPKTFFIPIVSGTIALLILLNLINVDSFIIEHHPPTVNGAVDYVFLSDRGANGYKGWIRSAQFAEEDVADLSTKSSFNQTTDYSRIYNDTYILGKIEGYLINGEYKYGDHKKRKRVGWYSYGPRGEQQSNNILVAWNASEKKAYQELQDNNWNLKQVQKLLNKSFDLQQKINNSSLNPNSTSSAQTTPNQ
jgi:hypothetical protein